MYSAVFVNDTGYRNNWGCQSTSRGARRIIGTAISGIEPSALVCLEHLDPKSTDNYLGECAAGRLRRILMSDAGLSTEDERYLLKLTRRFYGSFVDVLATANIVFYQAEGALTGRSFVEGERLLLLPFIAKVIFKKPVVTFNQTLFAKDPVFSRLLIHVFSKMDIVAVREVESLRWCLANGLQKTILVPDAAFLEPVVEGATPVHSSFAVTGTAMSDRLDLGSYLEAVHLVSQQTGLHPRFYLSTKADRILADLWQEKFAAPAEVLSLKSPDGVLENLVGERFLMGGRYHMAILSAIAGTPFLLLATNTHKNQGLLELLGLHQQVVSFSAGAQQIANAAVGVLKQEREYRSHVHARVRNLQEDIKCFADSLKSSIEATGDFNPEAIMRVFQGGSLSMTGSGKEPNGGEIFDIVGNPLTYPPLLKRLKLIFRRSRNDVHSKIHRFCPPPVI